MLYDVSFDYRKENQELHFRCISPNKPIYKDEVIFYKYDLESLQSVMLDKYGIKDTISTRTNELILTDFSAVPSFEGRFLVYEKSLAGAQLKTYGAGVNIYVNEFALYNYLAEENDWLGLADYSQRKKATRVKPHNVFGYVNFPTFDENQEELKISNERADFIQDLTFTKLMYLLKGVVMFAIFNIDVADKNPKYKDESRQENDEGSSSADPQDKESTEHSQTSEQHGNGGTSEESGGSYDRCDEESDNSEYKASGSYSPDSSYKPKKLAQKSLIFTQSEGEVIELLKDKDNLSNKIFNLVFELSKLDLQVHRHSIAYLYRALLESSTKYLSRKQAKVVFADNRLETSIVSALNHFGNISKRNQPLSIKSIQTWRDTVTKRKLIDTLNQYVHNEQPVDALMIQETWNTMKGYIIACLTIQ